MLDAKRNNLPITVRGRKGLTLIVNVKRRGYKELWIKPGIIVEKKVVNGPC